jgi:hypothetical protein
MGKNVSEITFKFVEKAQVIVQKTSRKNETPTF